MKVSNLISERLCSIFPCVQAYGISNTARAVMVNRACICLSWGNIKPALYIRKCRHRLFVGREGVEPSQYHYRRILSPLRLPIPPSPQRVQFYYK